MTTGRVYETVIHKERNLEYKGKCVEVVPHIPQEIIRRIKEAAKYNKADITIIEIGGTVGEYQNILFLEAARELKLKNPEDVAFVLVSYLPIPGTVGEMKTKPTQYASRTLNTSGIQADFIVCRSERPIDKPRRQKLATHCAVKSDHAISAPDVGSVYEIPVLLDKEKMGDKVLKVLGLKSKGGKNKSKGLKDWKNFVSKIERANEGHKELKIAIVGKYFGTGTFTLADSYISVIEAIKHACWHHGYKPDLTWVDAEEYEKDSTKVKELRKFDGVIVPGGFGTRGIEGIIMAIKEVRERGIPYFGLCYGMQLACIESARNVAKLKNANTVEVDEKADDQIIIVNPNQQKNILQNRYGGTMRLGAYDCSLLKDTKAREAYAQAKISERHRHRYEFNNKYKRKLEAGGMIFSGINKEQNLVEIVELAGHPWFVGVQFHPEFKSRPLVPHPLFRDFAGACVKFSK